MVAFDNPPRQDSWRGGKKEKLGLIFIGLLVVINFIAWEQVFSLFGAQYLKVDFFNVGQGDAIFIETPQKHQILIDGGPDSTILEKLAKEIPFWDKTIDLVILTHPERDHLTGLLEVLKRYKVDYILWTGVVRHIPEYDKWVDEIQKEKAKIIIAKNNQKIKAGGAVFDILNPSENLEGKELKDSNDTSIVSRLVFYNDSFLFTGDISSKTEEEFLEEKIDLFSNVLKVSHHGSKYSASEKFIEEVKPEIAVIQVGKNNYGHPTEEVLQRLKKFAINVLRTDKNGDIKFVSDGNNLILINN